MYKVSVVVPVFKVEKYIVRCAESLFGQTLEDIQFIFVDDASPDNSIALLEQVLERFPQRKPQTLILHHQKNKGLPAARATGLASAEAPYVAHCDSDDYVEPTMYADLYANVVQNDSDMVICGRVIHYPDGRIHQELDTPKPEDSPLRNFLCGRVSAAVWCRLTRTDIYRRVVFPKENYLEDWVQTAQLLTYARRVSFLEEFPYHYSPSPASITSDRRLEVMENKMRQAVENYRLMHDFIMEHHRLEEKDFILKKVVVRSIYHPQINRWSIRKKYLQTFPEINYSLLFSRMVPPARRAAHLLILLGLYPLVKPVFDLVRK